MIELAGLAPTPFCGMILADMGADVIRVDRPSTVASTDMLSRHKRSVQIDMKQAAGQQCLRRMLQQADVLLEGFRPGVLESLQLDPQDLLKEFPRLIVARLSGFGQTGPLRTVAGHDLNYVGLAGLLDFVGPAHSAPVFPSNYLADFAGGSYLCTSGILAALYYRERTGRGQVIDHAMTEGANYMNSFPLTSRYSIFGNERGTNMLDGGGTFALPCDLGKYDQKLKRRAAHFYGLYETKDGKYMTVGAIEPQFYAKLLQGLEFSPEEMNSLPHQMDNTEWDSLKSVFAAKFKSKTQAEWTEVHAFPSAVDSISCN